MNDIDAGAEHSIRDVLSYEGNEQDETSGKILSRALMLSQLDRNADSLSCVEHVLKKFPKNSFALHLKAVGLWCTGHRGEAIQTWKDARKITKNYSLKDRISRILTDLKVDTGGETS